ncbi:hypothetical protein D3C80_1964430 [compost metagenome]
MAGLERRAGFVRRLHGGGQHQAGEGGRQGTDGLQFHCISPWVRFAGQWSFGKTVLRLRQFAAESAASLFQSG